VVFYTKYLSDILEVSEVLYIDQDIVFIKFIKTSHYSFHFVEYIFLFQKICILPGFIGMVAYNVILNVEVNSKFTSPFLSVQMDNQMA